MPLANKMRVSTADSADAVDLACSAVEWATGVAAEPVFQEIDRDCVVIELRLDSVSAPSIGPASLASSVEREAPSIEVLSAWCEQSTNFSPYPRPSEAVVVDIPELMPTAVQRALSDGVPTSRWDASDSSWLLAVPARGLLAFAVVGLARRRGYPHRFDLVDAEAVRVGLAS
jgi:hypothetical protein